MTYAVVTDSDEETPLGILNRILDTHEELEELKSLLRDYDKTVAILFKDGELKLRGQLVAGLAALPEAQGAMKPLFSWLLEEQLGYHPDWLIILSADWWADASAIDREALVCHEAMHCGQQRDAYGEPKFNSATGEPMLGIRPHDVEEFTAVVRRYGAWTPDLVAFADALKSTDTDTRQRRDGSMSVSALRVVEGGRK